MKSWPSGPSRPKGKGRLRRMLRDRSGVTAVEYALMIGGISLGIITVVFALGDDLAQIFTLLADELNNHLP